MAEGTWKALGARRRAGPPPEPEATAAELESAWLSEQWASAGDANRAVAAALVAGISSADSPHVRHGLYLALLAERARVLELAGAWGWAIRGRRHVALLDVLLGDSAAAARDFYAAVAASRARSLVALLNLPDGAGFVAALADATGWSEAVCRRSLREGVAHAKLLGDAYHRQDELLRRPGGALLHWRGSSDQELRVVSAAPEAPTFRLDGAAIRTAETEIGAAATFLRYVAGLTRALRTAESAPRTNAGQP